MTIAKAGRYYPNGDTALKSLPCWAHEVDAIIVDDDIDDAINFARRWDTTIVGGVGVPVARLLSTGADEPGGAR